MKVKDLVAALLKQDQEATAVVQEYDGGDDACRPVSSVTSQFKNQLSWPSRHVSNSKPPVKVIPPGEKFVLISGMGD